MQSCAVTCHRPAALCMTPMVITLQGAWSLMLTLSEASMEFNAFN